jgi:aryl-alcohol dehydrogenase-like predicted oxidoreductase
MSSTFGFGCGSLQVTSRSDDIQRILAAAWDSGVRWFDTARSYGFGAAEGMLGQFLEGRRDEATVVTKFGINPPPAILRSAPVRGAARVARSLPFLKRRALNTANAFVERPEFSVATARRSLQTSLRNLRTDHVDALLLHEADLDVATNEELLIWLDSCVTAGTIGGWGVATTSLDTTASLRQALPQLDIVQVPDSVLAPARDALPPLKPARMVTHSVLRADLPVLDGWLAAEPGRRATWSNATGLDLTQRGELARLVLATALNRSGAETVLFSSRDPRRLAEAATAATVSGQAVSTFERLLAALNADAVTAPATTADR